MLKRNGQWTMHEIKDSLPAEFLKYEYNGEYAKKHLAIIPRQRLDMSVVKVCLQYKIVQYRSLTPTTLQLSSFSQLRI